MVAFAFTKRAEKKPKSHRERNLDDSPTQLAPESDPDPISEGNIVGSSAPLERKRLPVFTVGKFPDTRFEIPTERIRLLKFRRPEKLDLSEENEDARPTHWDMQIWPIERLKLGNTRYYALSYTWGRQPSSTKFYTYINNEKVEVSENLWRALKALSTAEFGDGCVADGSRLLWVDALCIYQNIISDRNAQVSMMGRIYAGASSVTVWLGPANTHSEILFKHRPPPQSVQKNKDKDDVATWFQITPEPKEQLPNSMDLPIEEIRDSIKDIASRPYWSRGWIRQELHFAKQVVFLCGEELAFAQTFSKLLGKLPPSYLEENSEVSNVERLVRSAMNYESWKVNLTLFDLLETYGRSQCTLKHDRIYSLLPMASDSPQAKGYRVDYSLPYEEVVVKAVAFCECPTRSRRYKLFSILGDDNETNNGFDEPTSKLLAYAEYLRAQHEEWKTWSEIMDIPYEKIRQCAPQPINVDQLLEN